MLVAVVWGLVGGDRAGWDRETRRRVRFDFYSQKSWASLVAQTLMSLPAMQETQVRSLGQEDPLQKGMATHPSTFAWRIPWTKEPGGLQSMGLQRVRHDWATNTYYTSSKPKEVRHGGLASVGQTVRLYLVPSQKETQSCVGPEPVQSTSGLLFSLGAQMPAFLFF